MSIWLRVFGRNESEPAIDAMASRVNALSGPSAVDFEPGERGWQFAMIQLPGAPSAIRIDRFWRDEEGIRQELQAWAAWLETCDYSPNNEVLMLHLTQTQQVFTLRRPLDHANEILLDQVCLGLCQFLAQATDGVYQLDGEGVFAADGSLLLQEY